MKLPLFRPVGTPLTGSRPRPGSWKGKSGISIRKPHPPSRFEGKKYVDIHSNLPLRALEILEEANIDDSKAMLAIGYGYEDGRGGLK
jgi:hypothetical protein